VAAAIAIAVELGLGLLVLVGWQTRWAALAIAVFTVVITFIFHAFWAVPAEQVMVQQQAFFKNIAVVGGLLMLVAFGPGGFSLDAKRK
jgi:putative oxidoreductase